MYKKPFLQTILFGLIVIIFAACDKDYTELGSDIVGDGHVYVEKYMDATVKTYNQKTGPIASNNLPINPLGIYKNPAFGTTRANFVTQVELSTANPTFNNTDPDKYQDKPVIDSVVLNIPYFSHVTKIIEGNSKEYKLDSIYGVEGSKFKLNVFRSGYDLRDLDPTQSLGSLQSFYTDQNGGIEEKKIDVLLNDSPREDGLENNKFYFDKRQHLSRIFDEDGKTKDSTYASPSMRLHLNKTVFDALILNAPSGQLANNGVFKNYFQGLYFKVENTGDEGNMAMLDFKKGKISIYYKEDKKKTENAVVTYERVSKTYVLNLSGNTVSLLNNTDEMADYLSAINSDQEASKLYLKGGEGSIAIIDLFGPDLDDDKVSDEIETMQAKGWMVNEANLTFYIDQPSMSDVKSIEPNRIFLYDFTNKKTLLDYNADMTTVSSSPKYNKYFYGGIIEKEKTGGKRGIKYTVRITNHVRNLIKNSATNVRLGLVVTENINNVGFSKLKPKPDPDPDSDFDSAPSMSVMNPLGTILHGSASTDETKRLKLEIYYTQPK